MKNDILLKINLLFDKLNINSDDGHNLIEHKNRLKSQILFNIFSNLINSENIQNLIFSSFEVVSEIYADIISATHNPNCSCRKKVFLFFGENFDLCKNIFLKILESNEVSYDELQVIYEMIESDIESINSIDLDLTGKILEINDNEKEYFDFIKKINDSATFFRGLNILKQNDKLKLYFY